MVATDIKNRYNENNRDFVTASIISDTKPDTLPITGQNIKGIRDDEYLAPGSSIFTINGDVIFLGENGWGDWL